MDGWEIARKDRIQSGKRDLLAQQARTSRVRSLCSPASPPLTCALAAAQWQLRRAAKRSPDSNKSRNKTELQKLLPLTSCLHGRVNSKEAPVEPDGQRA